MTRPLAASTRMTRTSPLRAQHLHPPRRAAVGIGPLHREHAAAGDALRHGRGLVPADVGPRRGGHGDRQGAQHFGKKVPWAIVALAVRPLSSHRMREPRLNAMGAGHNPKMTPFHDLAARVSEQLDAGLIGLRAGLVLLARHLQREFDVSRVTVWGIEGKGRHRTMRRAGGFDGVAETAITEKATFVEAQVADYLATLLARASTRAPMHSPTRCWLRCARATSCRSTSARRSTAPSASTAT